jgi:hypothetical protein
MEFVSFGLVFNAFGEVSFGLVFNAFGENKKKFPGVLFPRRRRLTKIARKTPISI